MPTAAVPLERHFFFTGWTYSSSNRRLVAKNNRFIRLGKHNPRPHDLTRLFSLSAASSSWSWSSSGAMSSTSAARRFPLPLEPDIESIESA